MPRGPIGSMPIPIPQPIAPMEALLASEVPVASGLQYEPKWDGFRCLAYRDGNALNLWSKAGQDLTRYFPEVAEVLVGLKARVFVLDGELIVPQGNASSFEALLQRIHPAQSRILRLANDTPAAFIGFDLLVDERGASLLDEPLRHRRSELLRFAEKFFGHERLRVSPATTDSDVAAGWLRGATGIDGVMAKQLDAAYAIGERTAMQKVKRLRTVDCVVGGFRYAEKHTPDDPQVGSLLLGLYNDQGLLDHVGFTSALDRAERARLAPLLEELVAPPGFTGRAPGGPSRWSTKRSNEWKPLRPEVVCEVRYDHFSEGRFRHGTKFLRWRPDKPPSQCIFEQVAKPRASSMALLDVGSPLRRGQG